jgi:hypothetical protein
MSKTKKPRKAYRPRPLINTIEAATVRSMKLTDAERELLINPVWDSFAMLRRGEIDNPNFIHLGDMLNVAVALTQPGIGLLPDHVEKWHKAMDVIADIAQRRREGKSWTCHAHELATLQEAIEYHDIQLMYASAQDVCKATQKVDRNIKGARSGSPGKFHIRTALPEAA